MIKKHDIDMLYVAGPGHGGPAIVGNAYLDAHKNWKFSSADIHGRKYWKQYMEAYEDCLGAARTGQSPWYVVPADDKDIVLESLRELRMEYPKTTPKRKRKLKDIRRHLET
jgi:hypothetical protein